MKRSGDEGDFTDMALEAELPGGDADAAATEPEQQPAAKAKAIKTRRKKVRTPGVAMWLYQIQVGEVRA